ncbi:Uncharacterised protein [Mycobacteroides abscessus subsp. abscessus]|nr:Uncharacterised protein [Mycobacteroides abscessus subsp. abscessus]
MSATATNRPPINSTHRSQGCHVGMRRSSTNAMTVALSVRALSPNVPIRSARCRHNSAVPMAREPAMAGAIAEV